MVGIFPSPAAFFSAQANSLCGFRVGPSVLWASPSGRAAWQTTAWENWLIAGGTFRCLEEDSPLPPLLSGAGPFDKAREVPFGLGVLFSAKILRHFLKRDLPPFWPPASRQQGPVHLLPLSLLSSLCLGRREERPFFFFIDPSS